MKNTRKNVTVKLWSNPVWKWTFWGTFECDGVSSFTRHVTFITLVNVSLRGFGISCLSNSEVCNTPPRGLRFYEILIIFSLEHFIPPRYNFTIRYKRVWDNRGSICVQISLWDFIQYLVDFYFCHLFCQCRFFC